GTYAHLVTDKNPTIGALMHYPRSDGSEIVEEVPFRSESKMGMMKVRVQDKQMILLLGAYDVLLRMLPPGKQHSAERQYEKQQLAGYRNLLFCKIMKETDQPLETMNMEGAIIRPVAIISLADETREEAGEALDFFLKE